MRCTATVRTRSGKRPCERPAVIGYPIDGTLYGRCRHHDTKECQRWAAARDIEPVVA